MALKEWIVVGSLVTALYAAGIYAPRRSFYAATLHCVRSSACGLVALHQMVLLALLAGKMGVRIFFGSLRDIEVEHLYERGWFAATESLLALTYFRDDLDVYFAIAFLTLLFLKVFHWVLHDRIEFMDQIPRNTGLFHARCISLIFCLMVANMLHVSYAAYAVFFRKTGDHGSWILFGFEYLILLCSLVGMSGRYVLNSYEEVKYNVPLDPANIDALPETTGWEEKGRYLLYLDLVIDFLKLVTYTLFFTLIVRLHGLPLHTMRDLYLTCRSFLDRVSAVIRYHKATRDMATRYKTVTEEELATGENTCVVCREEMKPPVINRVETSPLEIGKRLPCGHRFHMRCLKSWLERQQSCPICRRGVMDEYPEDKEARERREAEEAEKKRVEQEERQRRERVRHPRPRHRVLFLRRGERPEEAAPPASPVRLHLSPPEPSLLPPNAELIPLFQPKDERVMIGMTDDEIKEKILNPLSDDQLHHIDTDIRNQLAKRMVLLREVEKRVQDLQDLLKSVTE